jgi:large conductance mechanosensitive channel
MLKGFKDFVMRGNVVDLAIGVVIGAAFSALVTQFTTSFLTPLIVAVGAGGDNIGGIIKFGGTTPDGKPNGILYGAFISALIAFLLTAAVIYFLVVLPMNKFAERRARSQTPPPPAMPSEEIQLLRDIRDALVAGRTPQPRSPEQSERDEHV